MTAAFNIIGFDVGMVYGCGGAGEGAGQSMRGNRGWMPLVNRGVGGPL